MVFFEKKREIHCSCFVEKNRLEAFNFQTNRGRSGMRKRKNAVNPRKVIRVGVKP